MKQKVVPYGSWRSPITSQVQSQGASTFGELGIDGENVYWVQMRPDEGGRYALLRLSRDGQVDEVLQKSFNVRTRVHEYGGGSYTVRGGKVFFSNFEDQLVYVDGASRMPRPVTKPGLRYADYVVDEKRGRLIAVCEDHTVRGRLPTNCISTVGTDELSNTVLVSGNDFYSNPRLDRRGSKIAWLTWNFPNMPWDGNELWVADIKNDGSLTNAQLVAGGRDESIFQPEWSPEGKLHFVSDRNDWWNIYRSLDGEIVSLCAMKADFGRPLWRFGLSTYAFESEDRIVCTFAKDGVWNFAVIDIGTGKMRRIKNRYTEIEYVRAKPGHGFFIGGSPREPSAVVRFDPVQATFKVLLLSRGPKIHSGYLSLPKHLRFPTTGRREAFGLFYRPKNRDYRGPRGKSPPLIVISHGGPTLAARTDRNLVIQAWTSRGFAVFDVNYGGSTGYGREYRNRLRGQWGIVDVDDCVNGALHLAKKHLINRNRLIIRGASAGGYTTLSALAFRKVFKAGASYFGVSDLETFENETHKFESRYSDILVAPYPEGRQTFKERSPINYAHQIACPVIFFQGLEDVIIPPNQAEKMTEVLRAKGIPVAYVAFAGEQHGFRKAETIRRAFEAELYFYSKVFGFDLAEKLEPVKISNLST